MRSAGIVRYGRGRGRVRRAISVVKKRTGMHEDTIREYRIGDDGMRLGQPLVHFQGVLRGIPTYMGAGSPLLKDEGV